MSGARGQDVVSEETNVTAQRDELSRVISSMSCREGAPRNLVYLPGLGELGKEGKEAEAEEEETEEERRKGPGKQQCVDLLNIK